MTEWEKDVRWRIEKFITMYDEGSIDKKNLILFLFSKFSSGSIFIISASSLVGIPVLKFSISVIFYNLVTHILR